VPLDQLISKKHKNSPRWTILTKTARYTIAVDTGSVDKWTAVRRFYTFPSVVLHAEGGSELYGYSISFLHSVSFFSKIYLEPICMVLLRLIPFLPVASGFPVFGGFPVTGGRAMREVC